MRNSPRIINQALPDANTQYEIALPPNVTGIVVQARASDVRLAFDKDLVATAGAGAYFTVKAALRPYEVHNLTGVKRIYCASSVAGAVVEVVTYN